MEKQSNINYRELIITAAVTTIATIAATAITQRFLPSGGKGMGRPSTLLLNFSLEHQAKFADFVTVTNVNNLKWFRQQMFNMDVEDPAHYKGFNNTSIGNLAFLQKYSKHREIREIAKKVYDNLKRYNGHG